MDRLQFRAGGASQNWGGKMFPSESADSILSFFESVGDRPASTVVAGLLALHAPLMERGYMLGL